MKMDGRASFSIWFLICQLLGLISIGMLASWLVKYNGGFAWESNAKLEFSWHPLLMVIGLVFLNGNGLLVYRLLPTVGKTAMKIVHATIQVLSLIVSAVGLKAVFDSVNLNNPDATNLVSMHAWLGMATVILFCLQWLFGLLFYLIPWMSTSIKDSWMPIHRWLGFGVFAMAVANCIVGISEKSYGRLESFSESYVLLNSTGLVLVTFGLVVGYIVTNAAFQRPPNGSQVGEHIPLK